MILFKRAGQLQETRQQVGISPLEQFNPFALRKAKIVCNFGLSECNRVKTFRRAVMDEMLQHLLLPLVGLFQMAKIKIVVTDGLGFNSHSCVLVSMK